MNVLNPVHTFNVTSAVILDISQIRVICDLVAFFFLIRPDYAFHHHCLFVMLVGAEGTCIPSNLKGIRLWKSDKNIEQKKRLQYPL